MDKRTTIAVTIAVVVVLLFVGSQILINMSSVDNRAPLTSTADMQSTTMDQTNPTANTAAVSSASAVANNIVNIDGMEYEDTVVGTGATATAGNTVTVNYTGVLTDGTKFDSSLDHGQPFSFTLGAGNVIQGWDIGVAGMKVGGKRVLVIPATLGYGAQAIGAIPANSTLIFEVELLGVK